MARALRLRRVLAGGGEPDGRPGARSVGSPCWRDADRLRPADRPGDRPEGGGAVIGQERCKKLQHCIMNIDRANKVDELLELTVAR